MTKSSNQPILVIRNATKEDVDFDPDAPYLGRPNLEALAEDAERGLVLMFTFTSHVGIILVDLWRHVAQIWLPPRRSFSLANHREDGEPLQFGRDFDLLIEAGCLLDPNEISGLASKSSPFPTKLTFEGNDLEEMMQERVTFSNDRAPGQESKQPFDPRKVGIAAVIRKYPPSECQHVDSPPSNKRDETPSSSAPSKLATWVVVGNAPVWIEEEQGQSAGDFRAPSEFTSQPSLPAHGSKVALVPYKEDPIDFLCSEGFTSCGMLECPHGEEPTVEWALRTLRHCKTINYRDFALDRGWIS